MSGNIYPDKYRERVSTEMSGKFLPLVAPVINVYGRPDRAQPNELAA